MAKRVPIKYTSRDFNSIKQDLVEYAKRYYPETVKDFSQASFGSLMLDSVSYVGDILSFYLDYQVNESFLSTALQRDNILRLAKQMGYKPEKKPVSYGQISCYILVPASPTGLGPDVNYIPILSKGSLFTSTSGIPFTLIDDIDFSLSSNQVAAARLDPSTGVPTYYAIKAVGAVVSGQQYKETIAVSSFEKFKKLKLQQSNVVEMISVIDLEGHEYYEVDHLSQDAVLKEIKNLSTNQDEPTSILKLVPVPRRFVVDYDVDGSVYLQFGYGSDEQINDDVVVDPAQAILQLHARDYTTQTYFDPSDIIKTDKFGVAPSNTSLIITYRISNFGTSNSAANTLTNVKKANFIFKNPNNLNNTVINTVIGSLETTNEEPINGDIATTQLSSDELKIKISNFYAAQGRAVTAQDYQALIYSMPARYGSIKRVAIIQDNNSFKRNINMYVISEDQNGRLSTTNTVIKQNLKTYLSNYKMINDTIDILDAKIVNFGVNYEVISDSSFSKSEVLNNCAIALRAKYQQKFDIGEHLSISELYTLLNRVEGVSDVVLVEIVSKNGTDYSSTYLNLEKQTSPDGRYIKVPKNVIMELKYPFSDIKGTVR